MNVLEVKNVSTKVGDQTLIKEISLELKAGSIQALVGHNGAGKSTLIKTIAGVMEKTKGTIRLLEKYDQDEQYLAFKQHYAYLPEEPMLLTELTVMQHFQLYGMSYGLAEDDLTKLIDKYVTGFELTDKLNEYPESLSKGMRQKTQMICALLPDPSLLLIDEPFMGLDVHAMEYLEELIVEKARQGTAILITTHQLDRIKNIADTYMMLQHGVIQDEGYIESFETIKRVSDR